jgi:hypothetical protein
MKPAVLLLAAILLSKAHTWAQEGETINVNTGVNVASVLSFNQLYRYPQFKPGRIFYKDGTTAGGLLNFNIVLNEMQFISPGGDTLSVAHEATIKYLTVADDSFYYHKGFLEWISGNETAKLLKKQYLKELDKRKMGGYGMYSSTSAITSYNSYMADNTVYKLAVRDDVLMTRKVSYYIGNSNNDYLPASKKNIMKLFPKHQTAISRYLQQQEVNFDKESDLLKLIVFLQDL